MQTMPPKPSARSSSNPPKKKKRKLDDKKKRSKTKYSPHEELSNVCNITGGLGDELDCLDELANAQTEAGPSSTGTRESEPRLQRTPPPSLHEIPNPRVELARHLQVENLTKFLLKACPNTRMPTFERWLLDSKLEESDRMLSIAANWVTNPASKLHFKSKKKTYGRAALNAEENADQGRESAREIKESRILLKAVPSEGKPDNVDLLMMKTRSLIDPILPCYPLVTDSSSLRLVEEIVASNLKMNVSSDEVILKQNAKQIVSDLLNKCSDSVKEIKQLQNRFGSFQQVGFGKRRAKNSGSSSSGLVRAEWLNETPNSFCSLSYITTKKKLSTSTSGNTDETRRKKCKPFTVKINGIHYLKLRRMFDETYSCTDPTFTKENITHAFHAALFAIVIRYATLAGGQQLNFLRGGGMQGAIQETVFECFSKWFGIAGTECFASPFNAKMTQYYSAFPSPDIDGYFGSHGDFFRLNAKSLTQGWYELNPPFSPGIMIKMAVRLIELLEVARDREIDVTFIVVIPSCHIDCHNREDLRDTQKKKHKKKKKRRDGGEEESNTNALTFAVRHAALPSFKMLLENCSSHIMLSNREHGYVEGAQHLRPTQFKESQYDSSVIILRSKSCAKIDAKAFEADLREAFKSRHLVELQQRLEEQTRSTEIAGNSGSASPT